MNDVSLRRLLQSAEESDGHSRMVRVEAGDLLAALAVRKRRRAQRRALAACATVIVAGSAWRIFHNRDGATVEIAARTPHGQVTTSTDAADQWRRMEREAQWRLRVVREVRNAEAAERASASVGAADDSPDLLAQETARSAAISLQNAVQIDQEFHDAAAARREYQRVVERFPGTRWAQQAAQSLHRIPGMSPVSNVVAKLQAPHRKELCRTNFDTSPQCC